MEIDADVVENTEVYIHQLNPPQHPQLITSYPSRHGDTPPSLPSRILLLRPPTRNPSAPRQDGLGTPRTPRPAMLTCWMNPMPRTIRLASRVSRLGSFCMEGTRAGGARSRAACCIDAAWNAKPGRGGRRYDVRLGWVVFAEVYRSCYLVWSTSCGDSFLCDGGGVGFRVQRGS